MKELFTITNTAMMEGTLKFKNEHLAKITDRICAIYNQIRVTADEQAREISKLLADVLNKESYKEDGYKSVADYASQVFGMTKSTAYAMASAGKVYLNPEVPVIVARMSPSKVAELSTMLPTTMQKLVDEGTLTETMTQAQLRDLADEYKLESQKDKKKDGKKTIEFKYTTDVIPARYNRKDNSPAIMEDIVEQYSLAVNTEVIDLSPIIIKNDTGKVIEKRPRKLFIFDGEAAVITFIKYIPVKEPVKKQIKAPKPKPKYTIEELQAMLKEAQEAHDKQNDCF